MPEEIEQMMRQVKLGGIVYYGERAARARAFSRTVTEL